MRIDAPRMTIALARLPYWQLLALLAFMEVYTFLAEYWLDVCAVITGLIVLLTLAYRP